MTKTITHSMVVHVNNLRIIVYNIPKNSDVKVKIESTDDNKFKVHKLEYL